MFLALSMGKVPCVRIGLSVLCTNSAGLRSIVLAKVEFITSTQDERTVLKVKVWKSESPEPSAFSLEAVDTEPKLQGVAGEVGIRFKTFPQRTLTLDQYRARTWR